MKTRFPSARRAWRDRFLEIARQVEAGSAPRSLVVAAGIKARSRHAASGLPAHLRAPA